MENMTLLDFARGPGMQYALWIFCLGILWRIVGAMFLLGTKDISKARRTNYIRDGLRACMARTMPSPVRSRGWPMISKDELANRSATASVFCTTSPSRAKAFEPCFDTRGPAGSSTAGSTVTKETPSSAISWIRFGVSRRLCRGGSPSTSLRFRWRRSSTCTQSRFVCCVETARRGVSK